MTSVAKFKVEISKATNCICNICHGSGRVAKINYYTKDYGSNKRPGKICKTLQKHPRSIWICRKCMNDFKGEWVRSTEGLGYDYYKFYDADGKWKDGDGNG